MGRSHGGPWPEREELFAIRGRYQRGRTQRIPGAPSLGYGRHPPLVPLFAGSELGARYVRVQTLRQSRRTDARTAQEDLDGQSLDEKQ